MNILVYDSESGGHHREYFDHFLRYWSKADRDDHLYLAPHPGVAREIEGETPRGCTVVPLDRATVDDLNTTSQTWKRSVKEWDAMCAVARKCDPDHCVVPTLNWFQLALALPRAYRVPFTVSGILFFPYPRWQPEADTLFEEVRNALTRLRKWGLLWLMMRNPNVSAVHVFNDPETAHHLNRHVDPHGRFQSLPDPAPELPSPPDATRLRDRYGIDEGRTLFLFFGTISQRKGIFKVLKAMHELGEDERKNVALLVAGRPKSEQEQSIRNAAAEAAGLANLQVRTDFRFLDPDELALTLRDSDVILAPYQRTEGSSGVIGHAARWTKPVIGSTSGLIGDLIHRYSLGATVDATSPAAIRQAVTDALDDGGISASRSEMQRYVREHTPEAFARQLLAQNGKN